MVESPVPRPFARVDCRSCHHTVLIAKDKSELHIDDSAAPFRDLDGNITGVIMVFHNITDARHWSTGADIGSSLPKTL